MIWSDINTWSDIRSKNTFKKLILSINKFCLKNPILSKLLHGTIRQKNLELGGIRTQESGLTTRL